MEKRSAVLNQIRKLWSGWRTSLSLSLLLVALAAGAWGAPGDTLIHNSANLGAKYWSSNGGWGVAPGKFGQFTCATCHNRTTPNIKRVVQSIPTYVGYSTTSPKPVVFNNTTGYGNDAGGHTSSKRICEVCHTQTSVHRYNTTIPTPQADLNHKNANNTDCVTCHPHDKAFASSCGSCHGYPPDSTVVGAGGLASPATGAITYSGQKGAHVVHTNTLTYNMKCETCHNGYTINPMGNTKIEMSFAVNATTYPAFSGTVPVTRGTFTGNNTLQNGYKWYTTAQHGATLNTAANTATCSIYCHGSTLTGGTAATPSWVGTNQATCTSTCHGMSAATPPTTANHTRHAGAGSTNLSLACDKCHGAHPDNTHVNGAVKWDLSTISASAQYKTPTGSYATSGNTSKLAPSASYGQCNNLYCHSNVQGPLGTGTPTSYAQPTWGAVSVACDSCHWGDKAPFKIMSTGSHRKHIVAYSYQCSDCHNAAGHDTAKHADGNIDVVFASGGTYGQTGAPANGFSTCSNTICHAGAATAPTWGGAPMPADCSGCHGNATTRLTLTALHYKHVNNASVGGNFGCVDCHAVTVNNNTTIANKTLHANGLVNYSGVRAGRDKNCSNFYCHSNGKGTWQNPSTWAVATPLGCDGCHGVGTGSGMPNNSTPNSHAKHAPTAGDCYKCHFKTASTITGTLVTGTIDHLDGNIDARLTKPFVQATYSGAYLANKTCSATYCHGGTNPSATPAWGNAGSTNCGSCHKGNSSLPGAHAIHYNSTALPTAYGNYSGNMSTTTNYRFTCGSCHSGKKGAAHVNGPLSANGAAEVFYGFTSATMKGGTYAYGALQGNDNGFNWSNGSTNCNTTYCHSNGQNGNGLASVAWSTTASTGTCVQCHDTKKTSGTSGLSAKHDAHMNPAVNTTLGLGNGFNCVDCHAKTVSNNTSLSNRGKHVNKFIDYSGVRAGGSAKYNAGIKQCSNIYCHSNGNVGAALAYVNPAAWNSATTYGCNGCHGTSNPNTGAPDYSNGGAGTSTANSHAKHVGNASNTFICANCHVKTIDQVTTAKFKDYTAASYHLNGTPNVYFKSLGGKTGTWNGSACSATYCHGTAASSAWGSPALACNACHAANSSLPGAHAIHYNSTALPTAYGNYSGNMSTTTNYRFTCGTCHSALKGAGHANAPANANGAAEVFYGFTSATMKGGTYAYGTLQGNDNGFNWSNGSTNCNTTYCHSNGQNGSGLATVAWSTTVSGTGCNACHGNATTSLNLSPLHYKHVNNAALGGNFACIDCHATTVSNNTTIANKSKHVNKFIDYSGASAGRNKTCSNFYCHSDGKGNYRNPSSWAVATPIDCGGCHGTSPTGSPSTGNHAAHLAYATNCFMCHNGTTNAANSITGTTHINRVTNDVLSGGAYKTLATVSFSYVGTTCSNINCHSMGKFTNPSASWGSGSTLKCDGCHPVLSTGAHGTHAGLLNLQTQVTFYNYTANKSAGAEGTPVKYGFGCANCHPMDEATYHMDGTIEVQLDAASGGTYASSLRKLNTGSAVYNGDKSCDLVYCHSDGKNAMVSGLNGHAPAWTTTFATLGGDRCAKCHLNSPQTAAHDAHQVGLHYNNVFNGTSGKLAAAASGSSSHGVAGQSTTITCNTCHYKTMSLPYNDQNALCNTCHTKGVNGALVKGNAKIADFSFHVNGKKDIAFPTTPLKVISKAQLRTTSFSNYSGLWVRNGGNYKNGTTAFDTAKVALTDSMYSTTGGGTCANISCHNLRAGQTVIWTDTTISCQSCHTNL